VNSEEYEKLVAATIQDLNLAGAKQVCHQRDFVGKMTGRNIKVDVSFELELHEFTVLCLVECKWYNHKVDVSEVEEFRSKMEDIGAHKGLMFTTVGFQDGAVKYAKAYGIGLARLSDSARPGDMHAITNSLDRRMQPMQRIAGEVLSGALYVDLMGVEGWKWFPCGKALLNELYLVDCLSSKKPAAAQT
jgi:hypothetical protein